MSGSPDRLRTAWMRAAGTRYARACQRRTVVMPKRMSHLCCAMSETYLMTSRPACTGGFSFTTGSLSCWAAGRAAQPEDLHALAERFHPEFARLIRGDQGRLEDTLLTVFALAADGRKVTGGDAGTGARRRAVEKSASELAQLWRDARADQIDPTLVICRCAWNQVPCLSATCGWV
jgi:hypothetical protein